MLLLVGAAVAQDEASKKKKEKPNPLPRVVLMLGSEPWDGREPLPPDITFRFTVLPPTLNPPEGAKYRMASAAFFYSTNKGGQGFAQVGKAQSSEPGSPMIYRLGRDEIEQLLDKKIARPQVYFTVTSVIRILPDGTELEEELKDKQRTLAIPILRE